MFRNSPRISRRDVSSPPNRRSKLSLEALERRDVLTPTSALVANLIVNSLEDQVNLISSFYERFLQRPPDATGIDAWVRQLQAGVSPEAIEASFAGSSEYVLNHGNTAGGFLLGLYADVLGRLRIMAVSVPGYPHFNMVWRQCK